MTVLLTINVLGRSTKAACPLQKATYIVTFNKTEIVPELVRQVQYFFDNAITVESTLVGSKILKKGKCICKTIEMCFKGLISVPIYVQSIEKHVRHLV